MSTRRKIQLRETVTGGDPSAVPSATLIVLHGLGADGQDFAPLVTELDLSSAGPVRFVFPNAPLRTVSLGDGEPGQPMRAWYDPRPVAAETGAVSTQDEEGLRASCEVVQALIDREAARGVPPGHVVLPQRAESSRDKLLRLGYDIAWHDYPMGHEVCPREIRDLNGWLSVLLAPWH